MEEIKGFVEDVKKKDVERRQIEEKQEKVQEEGCEKIQEESQEELHEKLHENVQEEKCEKIQKESCEKGQEKGSARKFGKAEWYLAGILLAAGWLYGNLLLPSSLWKRCSSMTVFAAFHLLCVGAGLFYLSQKKQKIKKQSWWYLGCILISLVWFLWFLNYEMYFSMLLFLFAMCVYWVVALFGKQSGDQLDERAVGDWLYAVFIVSFVNFFQNFLCVGEMLLYEWKVFGKTKKKRTKRWGETVFGAFLAVPVLLIVIPLLMRADQSFQKAMTEILDWFFTMNLLYVDMETWIRWFVIMVVWCYLFGLFYGTMRTEKRKEMVLGLPERMLEGFLAVIVMVYLFFYLVKFAGIRASMGKIEQGELWVSTYARDGFFELCWIGAINFCVFVFARWGSSQVSRRMRCFLCVLGAETIAFAVLAFSKMHLYVITYGWTFKRLYASWFMLLLLVTFGLLVGQLKKNYNAVRIAFLFGCVTFLMLAFGHPYVC